jgi:hypothetical protein
MQDIQGGFSPDRQRRFDGAFTGIARLCRGDARRISDWPVAHPFTLEPAEIERTRWLIIAMPRARATPGNVAIERLSHRGQGRVLHGSMTISSRSETVRGSTEPSVTVILPEFGGVERTVGVALPSLDTGSPCESRLPSPADKRRTLPPRMPAFPSSYRVGDRPGTRSPKGKYPCFAP